MERNLEYERMKGMRGKDIYPNAELEQHLVEKVFPPDSQALATKLSNVTAGFYGIGLKQVGLQFGWEKVDGVSEGLFRELGHLKAKEAKEMGVSLPGDSRGLPIVFVTAVFTSSPEYNFEFKSYKPEETVLRIFGACRYYRIAKRLGIAEHLTHPVLIPFFEGIGEELGVNCSVEMKANSLQDDGTCEYMCTFRMKG